MPNRSEPISVLVVGGPTASGKTGLAIALAQKFDGVIINADSQQLYKDLPILTARPDAQEEASAPHRLFGVLGPEALCSATQWRDMACDEIRHAHKAGKKPILVGGTGFYLRTLMQGMSPVPVVPDSVRMRLANETQGMDGYAIHDLLASRDPKMAARLVRGDTQRCLRALEVLEHTGKSLAVFQDMPKEGVPADMVFDVCLLEPSRADLYARCNLRFDQMIAQGAMIEVQALLEFGVDVGAPVFRALGARELAEVVQEGKALAEAVVKAKTTTRHYAKRQVTWFRHQITTGGAISRVVRIVSPDAALQIF